MAITQYSSNYIIFCSWPKSFKLIITRELNYAMCFKPAFFEKSTISVADYLAGLMR